MMLDAGTMKSEFSLFGLNNFPFSYRILST